MPTFTVHAPAQAGNPRAAAEQTRFVREGFSWGAFLFGPLWLIRHGLWRALAGWAVAMIALALLARGLHLSAATPWLLFLVGLYLGLEAAALRRAALARSGFVAADVVAGADLESAERKWFERAAALFTPAPTPPAGPAAPAPRGGTNQIIGLFPQAGGRA